MGFWYLYCAHCAIHTPSGFCGRGRRASCHHLSEASINLLTDASDSWKSFLSFLPIHYGAYTVYFSVDQHLCICCCELFIPSHILRVCYMVVLPFCFYGRFWCLPLIGIDSWPLIFLPGVLDLSECLFCYYCCAYVPDCELWYSPIQSILYAHLDFFVTTYPFNWSSWSWPLVSLNRIRKTSNNTAQPFQPLPFT